MGELANEIISHIELKEPISVCADHAVEADLRARRARQASVRLKLSVGFDVFGVGCGAC